jgi:hypothetical protein
VDQGLDRPPGPTNRRKTMLVLVVFAVIAITLVVSCVAMGQLIDLTHLDVPDFL